MMNYDERLPTSLKVVAWLFMLSGALSLLEVVLALLGGRIDINFGVLGLPIGWGLLHLSRGWRTLALIFLGIALIGIPIVMVLGLASGGTVTINILGLPAGTADKSVFVLVAVLALAMATWQYRVLTSDEIRRLFEAAPRG